MATASLLERCRVRPPADMAADVSVPLSQFDIGWVHSHLVIRFVFFYDHPSCSKPYFLSTLVPQLKASLCLTLKHYPVVAGNLLIYPATTRPPVIRYVDGDGVSLAIAEWSSGAGGDDFDELVGNHPRDADHFYQLAAEMPPAVEDVADGSKLLAVPVMAIRVTLFPGRGVCFGFSFHHALGDVRSIQAFISAWAQINYTTTITTTTATTTTSLVDDQHYSLPIFDRSVVKDPHGYAGRMWNAISRQSTPLKLSSCFSLPTNSVRATYVLHRDDINKLKDLVLAKKPGATHVSSFVVTTCYVWSCLAKSRVAAGEEAVDGCDVLEYFVIPVDMRARLDPPAPANYFGNCLGTLGAQLQHEELVGDEGFVIAAAALADSVKNRADDVNQMLQIALDWMSRSQEGLKKAQGEVRGFVVSCSPRVDMASADFGWGKARKVEVVSIDGEKYAMSLLKSHDSEGGLEVGLSLPKKVMEAFDVEFARGLSFS